MGHHHSSFIIHHSSFIIIIIIIIIITIHHHHHHHHHHQHHHHHHQHHHPTTTRPSPDHHPTITWDHSSLHIPSTCLSSHPPPTPNHHNVFHDHHPPPCRLLHGSQHGPLHPSICWTSAAPIRRNYSSLRSPLRGTNPPPCPPTIRCPIRRILVNRRISEI